MEIEVTGDGSHTLFIAELDEHYHSTNGAIEEARHVFIKNALGNCNKSEIKVLEIGFGTGLNAFLTMKEAEYKNIAIKYTTLELHPIDMKHIEMLNYAEMIDESKKDLYKLLHTSPWEILQPITNSFSIQKRLIDFSNADNLLFDDKRFDVVYFDAFGPDKQPEMWQKELFDKIYSLMADGGTITTYSAKGAIRRMLQETGFKMERLPGPPGKREMLRGVK